MKQQYCLSLVCIFLFSSYCLNAQTSENPVEISIHNPGISASPGGQNYVSIQFQVPKGIWLGADKGEARTPPGTQIITPEINGFRFGNPQYPNSIKEWVPAKLGTTQVFKEKFTVIVPFSLESDVKEGSYDLPFRITYTPGYNAGRLATHYNVVYSTNITVSKKSDKTVIPAPSMSNVSDDFYVKPKSYEDIPQFMKFMFNPLNENSGLISGLHKILSLIHISEPTRPY